MTYGFDYDSISFLHIMKKCKCELEVFDDNLERDVNTIFTGKNMEFENVHLLYTN